MRFLVVLSLLLCVCLGVERSDLKDAASKRIELLQKKKLKLKFTDEHKVQKEAFIFVDVFVFVIFSFFSFFFCKRWLLGI